MVLIECSGVIEALDDYRDNRCAHLGVLKRQRTQELMTFSNVKRMVNFLKASYDGLAYAVAPDIYSKVDVRYNIDFSRMNEITKFYLDKYSR
jgi:hypothetical protein